MYYFVVNKNRECGVKVNIKLFVTGVEVAFQEAELTVGESDGFVRVCAIVSGQIESDVVVTYVTMEDSAGGRLI